MNSTNANTSSNKSNKNIKRKLILSIISGLGIGFLSGLIGVGGGEFRLPILLSVFELPLFFATATNLIIGILISLVSFLRRYSLMTPGAFEIALFMGAASIIGGYAGAYITGKVKERIVGYILIVFLMLVGLKLTISPLLDIELPRLALSHHATLALLSLLGATIGLVSGVFGVAGGEFRIPALMYFAATPIKLAGTISSLVALPAQIASLWKHHQLKRVTKEGALIALAMGAASVVGSFFGATLVFIVNEKLLECLLGIALLCASYGTYRKLRHSFSERA